MDYTMAQAKRDFERGFLKGFDIRHCRGIMDESGGFWFVELRSTMAMNSIGCLVDARTLKMREFKTMDSAVSALRQVGFKAVWLSSGEAQ